MSLPAILAGLMAAVDETLVLAAAPPPETRSIASALPLCAALLEQFLPILHSLLQTRFADPAATSIRSAVESLDAELARLRAVIRNSGGSAVAARYLESSVRGLGHGARQLLDAWPDAPLEIREGAEELIRGLGGVSFVGTEIRHDGGVVADVEDLMVRAKAGEEDGLGAVLSEIEVLVGGGVLTEEQVGSLAVALLNRLCSAKSDTRVKIMSTLRSLTVCSNASKEKLAGTELLSCIVRSLSRDVDERREAVGLLLDIADGAKVRQKIGRIQGCIVMLITLQNGDDPHASHDAQKLLGILSSNTQNVLLMAEAGYFLPLIHYLKQGSEMNKILMATALSRMFLTEQMRVSLGAQGAVEPLVKMFTSGKLEAKISALDALRNLCSSTDTINRLIDSGVIAPLLQVLFSVTSVLMTLQEPASTILAILAQSKQFLFHKDVALQMLSLLNLSSPAIQLNLLRALVSITSHSDSERVTAKLRKSGAMQLLLPFVINTNAEIRIVALNLVYNLSRDDDRELTKLQGGSYLDMLVKIISTSTSDSEKAAAVGILSNLPVKDTKVTESLMKANLIPLLISLLGTSITNSTSPVRKWLLESIAGMFIRFTIPSDHKLQNTAVADGVMASLVKLLSEGSTLAKSRAATSLAQLSQNSLELSKVKSTRWLCVPPSSERFCEVHRSYCTSKSTFCLLKAGAVAPLVRVLQGKEHEADEAALDALSTLMQDEIWEDGSRAIERASGVEALLMVLEVGSLKAQEKAIWMLERVFRLEAHREQYGKAAQILLINLAQKGDCTLRPMIGRILAHLQLLQLQSSYF